MYSIVFCRQPLLRRESDCQRGSFISGSSNDESCNVNNGEPVRLLRITRRMPQDISLRTVCHAMLVR
jgi:hypothetical protein